MCHSSCIIFAALNLTSDEVEGKKILEVGSFNVNGGLRDLITALKPAEYIGIDIAAGPGVDEVCAAEKIIEFFGENKFDLVISTEMLEHVKDWRIVISNMKRVCKKEGYIIITTRSKGYPYHPSPTDFWRFEKSDMKFIFSDCEIKSLELDKEYPGIFIKVKKPKNFVEKDIKDLALYNVITNKRQVKVKNKDFYNLNFVFKSLKIKTYKIGLELIKMILNK